MGGHVFLEYMSFRMTCIMGTFVIRKVMLCRRTCIMGGHVLQVCMYSGWYIFQDMCLTGMHVLQNRLKDIISYRTCLTGVYVL